MAVAKADFLCDLEHAGSGIGIADLGACSPYCRLRDGFRAWGRVMPDVFAPLQEFAEITRVKEPLALYTQLTIGGPAQALVEPRPGAELQSVVRRCEERRLPWRVLGGGGNLLIRDEGVKGVVLRLSGPAFTGVEAVGRRIRAGAGAGLASLISQAARHGL